VFDTVPEYYMATRVKAEAAMQRPRQSHRPKATEVQHRNRQSAPPKAGRSILESRNERTSSHVRQGHARA
jgi:hypothetical protein